MRITARSVRESAPMTSASNSRRSNRETRIRVARRMTCSLVRMMPAASMITPVPRLRRLRRRGAPDPRKNRSNSGGRKPGNPLKGDPWRTTSSVLMLTTAGPTFRTTRTVGVRRENCARAGAGARANGKTARRQTARGIRPLRRREEDGGFMSKRMPQVFRIASKPRRWSFGSGGRATTPSPAPRPGEAGAGNPSSPEWGCG